MPESLVRQLEAAEETVDGLETDMRRRVCLYTDNLRQVTNLANGLAGEIQRAWFEMADDDQSRLSRLQEKIAEADGVRKHLAFVKMAEHLVSPEKFNDYEADLHSYRVARNRLSAAIADALAEEERRLLAAEVAIAQDPESLAAIEIGDAEINDRNSRRFSKEEFSRRFALK